MTENRADLPALKRDMTLADVVSLGVSASVGVSIFSVYSPAAALAGPALILSLALALVPMFVFLVVYSFMGSAAPASGSSYVWPARFVHPYFGFIIAWLRFVTFAGIARIMGSVFADYLGQLVQLPEAVVMLTLFTVFFAVNLIGVGIAGKAARFLVGLKLVVIAAFIVLGLPQVDWNNFMPFAPKGTIGVLAALPLLTGLFGGIESAAEVGDEIRNSRSAMGRGMTISVFVSFLVYTGIALVTIGVLGSPGTAVSKAALAEAGSHLIGKPAIIVVVVVALLSISAAFNTLMLITSRFVFAMGRDGVLPTALSRIHPTFGTPYVSLLVTYLVAVGSLLLPSNLIFLFLAVNVPTILKYGCNCIAAIRLVNNYPELHAGAELRLSRSTVKWWAWAGVVCSVLILIMGLSADVDAYLVLLACTAVGTLYWFARGRRLQAAVSAKAAELQASGTSQLH